MSKNMFDDIKPITRVPKARPVGAVKRTTPKEVPYVPQTPRRSSRYGLWYFAGICIVGLLFALSFLFEHATITITPKSMPFVASTSDSFTAVKDAPEGLSFTLMSVEGSESTTIPGIESGTVSEKARGTVVLYNAYRSTSYPLVNRTRLESPDGRIYRIDRAVTIPGYKKTGNTITPGSVEVTVTADVGGEAGNIEQVDFTIPGLAGTSQAAKIYARAKTPISGGISGRVYSVEDGLVDAKVAELTTQLKDTITAKTNAQIPEGYVLLEGASRFVINDELASAYSKEANVPVAVTGVLHAFLLKEDALARAIAQEYVSQYGGAPVSLPNTETFALRTTNTLDENLKELTFSLDGGANIVWVVETENLKETLAGEKKSNLSELLEDEVSVERAEVTIRPFWKQSFPDETKRITISVEGE